jgi:hypothetical protein
LADNPETAGTRSFINPPNDGLKGAAVMPTGEDQAGNNKAPDPVQRVPRQQQESTSTVKN